MGKAFQRLCGRRGQHAIEYSVIVILIMAAIIIAGPHVIRSWNANVQGWEDSVIDSFEDPLLTTNAAFGLPSCECNFAPGDPNFDCGLSFCGPLELYEQCICNPVGCGRSSIMGCQEGSGRCQPCPNGCCESIPMACDFANGCRNTQMNCCSGSNTICVPDPTCSGCIEPVVFNGALMTVCPGFGVNLPGPGASNITIIPCLLTNPTDVACNCSNSPPEGHCNVTCNPPYFPVFGNTSCGFCPPGYALEGNCSAGNCETPPSCAAGQCLAG